MIASPAESQLTPEFRLLANALCPDASKAEALLRNGWTNTNFELLHALAKRHRVAPALAQVMIRSGMQAPAPFTDMPGATLSQAAFRELAFAATTRQVLETLDAAGTPAVVLKGVPLSFRLHGRLGLRVSRDIDLLVAPDDVAPALDALAAIGFRPKTSVDRQALPLLMRRRKDIELWNEDERMIVELHWRLFDNPYLMRLDGQIATTRMTLQGGLSCLVLEDRVNLLYLANHGAQHGWSRLKWLADFAALAHLLGSEMCGSILANTPNADGRRALGQAWLLAAELMAIDLPPAVAQDVRRDVRLRMLTAMARTIVSGSGATEIEAIRFGSTRKNVSHYLIRSDPAYLLTELRFDLAEFPDTAVPSNASPFGILRRILSWGHRHFFAKHA